MGLPLGLLPVLQHVDVPRMREGGLTAAFFSTWVDAITRCR